jgi:ubiquitin-like 1-activating enzyme E1 B
MGSPSFPRLLFDKVYKDDILRLRSMEDMWKSRRKPKPLEYATALAEIEANLSLSKEKLLRTDQRPWTFAENVVVFNNR